MYDKELQIAIKDKNRNEIRRIMKLRSQIKTNVKKDTDNDVKDCMICNNRHNIRLLDNNKQEYDQTIVLITLSCNHYICNKCIKQTIDFKSKCPLCRRDITDDDIDHIKSTYSYIPEDLKYNKGDIKFLEQWSEHILMEDDNEDEISVRNDIIYDSIILERQSDLIIEPDWDQDATHDNIRTSCEKITQYGKLLIEYIDHVNDALRFLGTNGLNNRELQNIRYIELLLLYLQSDDNKIRMYTTGNLKDSWIRLSKIEDDIESYDPFLDIDRYHHLYELRNQIYEQENNL